MHQKRPFNHGLLMSPTEKAKPRPDISDSRLRPKSKQLSCLKVREGRGFLALLTLPSRGIVSLRD